MSTQTDPDRLCALLERLCAAVESLNADLKPELRKTASLERARRERKALEVAAEEAVRRQRKDK